MTKTLRFALAAPLALALAACGSGAEETGEIKGDAIAAIPAPAGTEWRSTAVMTDDGGVLVGNPDAPLKLMSRTHDDDDTEAYTTSTINVF